MPEPPWDRRVALGTEPSETRRNQPVHKGWHSRGYLPHFDAPGLVQHLTYHLADSLPRQALDRMQRQLARLPEAEQSKERRKRIEDFLDQGYGSCALRSENCAHIVQDSLLFGDGVRYRLLAWVIMPNHIHYLIEQFPEWPLSKLIQSHKRHTSREIHRLEATLGSPSCTRPQWPNPLWQRDYFDRFMRDENHFHVTKTYIENNPVKAGLVDRPENWPWSSAHDNP